MAGYCCLWGSCSVLLLLCILCMVEAQEGGPFKIVNLATGHKHRSNGSHPWIKVDCGGHGEVR